ncbi:glycoside hydrolase family 3 C-terminal domain-containing protein [Sphaerisporangium fuscum]|uniref:glycoside hydrolase family 3 C-terminal domain-containing protein n=1 Tax=Sphaerisporangium fuscum TaxID=2835868 RepID=UPI001BDD1913|nr:glycoside hydrolase family 3 C-terminal domain-containing protein [Sphaerisporangium fuscum]
MKGTCVINDDVDRLVHKLDLDQKSRLVTGASVWRTHAEPGIGLRAMVFSDGPAGVRGEGWDERDTSLTLPCPTALAATWDEDLVARLGGLLAAEARRKGVDVLLAPTLNLHRSPLAGRHFECYSEDPVLAGRIGAALVGGVQAGGVAATAKHYVANDSETERLTLDARVDERTLRELYLAPFEAVVAAGVWVVMSAYNAVNSITMSENPLLATPLKDEWGFDGVVVSDWGAVRSTAAAGRAAQDLAMPGPDGPWGRALAAAVRAGQVPEAAVDDKVRRLLLLAARVGALDLPADDSWPPVAHCPALGTSPSSPRGPAPGSEAGAGRDEGAEPADGEARAGRGGRPEAAEGADGEAGRDEGAEAARGEEAARTLLRRAVAASAVLLRNEGGLLPLDPARPRRVAVLGPGAATPRVQGGGSAGVYPRRTVSPLDGVREALPATVEVVHAAGVARGAGPTALGTGNARDPRTGEPGLLVRLLDAAGREIHAEHRLTGHVPEPARTVRSSAAAVEIRALLRPDVSGPWELGVAGWGRVTLEADGRVLVDEEVERDTDDPATVHLSPPYRTARLALEAGREVELVSRRRLDPGTGVASALAADPPRPDETAGVRAAAGLARSADVAVVVVGTGPEAESEGADRTDLDLPGRQDELVRAVAAANPATVVIVNAGGPVALPWRDEVPAVLLNWFPGQEAGHGLADVLFGRAEPGGRLPVTFADRSLTSTVPVDGTLTYAEGLDIGHRAWLRQAEPPAYWFGHGLGYTTWAYEELSVPAEAAPGLPVTVRVRLRNTGARPGREVVQVYLARPGSAVARPARWLAGYTLAGARPGETAEAELRLPARAFQHWDTERGAWRTEAGRFTVLAGRSSAELPLSAAIRV